MFWVISVKRSPQSFKSVSRSDHDKQVANHIPYRYYGPFWRICRAGTSHFLNKGSAILATCEQVLSCFNMKSGLASKRVLPRALKPPYLAVAVQIALNIQEGRQHLLSNCPPSHTRGLPNKEQHLLKTYDQQFHIL